MCFYHDIDFRSDNSLVYPKENPFLFLSIGSPSNAKQTIVVLSSRGTQKSLFFNDALSQEIWGDYFDSISPKKKNEIETEANGTKRNNNEVAIGNKLNECYLMLRCASRAISGPHEANKNDGKFIAKN